MISVVRRFARVSQYFAYFFVLFILSTLNKYEYKENFQRSLTSKINEAKKIKQIVEIEHLSAKPNAKKKNILNQLKHETLIPYTKWAEWPSQIYIYIFIHIY